MVSHDPGLVLNAFYYALNITASAFNHYAFIFAAITAVYYIVSFLPLSYLRHFPFVHHYCGVI